MIIAQITDLHVVARDRLCYGKVPTNTQLEEVVAHINGLDPRPDAVIASGDLTNHGREAEYEVVRDILSKLTPPVFVIPGNHDRRDVLLRAFAGEGYMPRPDAPFVNYAVDQYPVRLIGLDTTVPGHHYGLLCEERLRWLDDTLGARPESPTLIFMHHPPFRTGIRLVDSMGLHGGRKMQEIVRRHRQAVGVVCGHVHRSIHLEWGGTVVSTSPSTCAQVSLDLGGEDDHFIMEPRAIQLHVWDPGYGLISHLSYVPGSYERISLFDGVADEVRAGFLKQWRKDYGELCRSEYDAEQVPLNGVQRGPMTPAAGREPARE